MMSEPVLSDSVLRQKIRELFMTLLLRDRSRMAAQVRALDSFDRPRLEGLHHQLENLSAHNLVRFAERLRCTPDPALPITAKAGEIAAALRDHQVVIICGATGSGKTTQLPKIALSVGFGRYGRIGCTQPRRIAASSLARRLASETGCECGCEVGYKVRFDDRTGRNTVIKFMTDGILLAETRTDPRLLEYDCLILDEVHERTLNIDFLLGYVRNLLQKRRNLRVIISSATLETQRISDFFSGAPVIEVEGRMYPVEDCFLPPEEDEELPDSVARGVEFLTSLDPLGDILVFLPGEREIRDCMELLEGRKLPRTELLPLFGRLSAGDQQKVFHPGSFRRIILATNVAETSITIPGIRFVIDSGLVRLSRYNPRSRIQELRVEPVSKASARQRRGRCGRVQDGVCVHLYSEEDHAEYADFTPPEIQRSSLAGVLLQMEVLRLGRIEDFPLMDPPSSALVREGRQMLEDLRAAGPDGRLTRDGRVMAEMPLDPHLAKMLISAVHYKILPEMLVIAAWLSIPDPRERPFEAAAAADQAHRQYSCPESDFLSVLVLHHALEELLAKRNSNQALRQFARKNYYNYRRLREWRNLIDDLKDVCRENRWNCEGKIDPENLSADAVHKALMSALPRQLGCFDPETALYSDMKGKKFVIFPGSALAKLKKTPPWIMSFVLVETSRVFARTNAVVQPRWLEETAPHICSRTYDLIRWDPESGFVYARERVMAGQLLIHPGRRCAYARVRPDEARLVFIREGLASGLARLPGSWLDGFNGLVDSLRQLETRMRRPDSILDTRAVIEHFEKVLPAEINSVQTLKEDWLKHHRDYSPEPDDIVMVPFDELHEEDYPDSLSVSGIECPLDYVFDPGEENDGITLRIRREMLNLLNPFLPEYLVPGCLEEKVGFMLRSMNKSLRRQFMPLDEVQEAFMAAWREGSIFTGRDLADSLCAFLRDFRGDAPDPAVFREMELPEYLIMKIAVSDEKGHVRIYREFPGGQADRSRLTHALPAVRKFHCSAADGWPGNDPLPETMEFSEKNPVPAYPALTLENGRVARELFLDEREARSNHDRAVLHLWKQALPQILKPLRNFLRPTPPMELEYFLRYPDWKDDVIDLAVRDAMGGDLWAVRSAEDFDARMEESRDLVAGKVTERFDRLQRMDPMLREVRASLERLRTGSPAAIDAEQELGLYFRPGFFRTPELFDRTPRYLKALAVRLRRASDAPEKDRSKGEYLESYIRKARMAEDAVGGIEKSPGLLDFVLLLEEHRIAVFAPEIRPLVKCSEKIIGQAWQDLKLK
ncbi:MAG: ATP-dependent RNA helicase HrpA [Lentisphaeria bacterium]|nr:ATP-dependent RNA helicase HrpA [Lentisphaeria bacterium]